MQQIFILLFFISISYVTAQNHIDADGLKQGPWSKKYPWGSVRYEGEFTDDKEVGIFRFYDQNEKLISERQYETPGGISNAVIYMPNGSIEAIGRFNGKNKIGEWKYFSTRGYLVSTDVYVDGLKDGPENKYYSDSTLAEYIEWKLDKKNGLYAKYFSEGSYELKANYLNDQLHGLFTKYYISGEKRIAGEYKKGLKHGKWFYYSEKGKQEKMEVYDYGDLIKMVKREGDDIKTIQYR